MDRVSLSPRQRELLRILVSGMPPLDPIMGPWVAGGSVRAVVIDGSLDNVHDVDVFFRTGCQSKVWVERMVELGYESAPSPKGTRMFVTQWNMKIQLVTLRQANSAVELLDSFSITACQFVTDGYNVWCGDTSIEDAEDRKFRIYGDTSISYRFVEKYLDEYGYTYDGDRFDIPISNFWYEEGM